MQLGPAFLQSSDSVVEESLILVFQPEICNAVFSIVAIKFAIFFRDCFQL